KLAVLTMALSGVLAMVPNVAYNQNQSSAVPSPLIGVTSTSKNPLQIALLHWYDANKTTSFIVQNQPFGVVFDGANVWVVNKIDSSVTKLRASDGAVLGTFPVGSEPRGVAFDGANIWVTN